MADPPAAPSAPLSKAEVNDRLIKAIHAHRLHREVESLLALPPVALPDDARPTVLAAAATLAAIASDIRQAQQAIIARLAAMGFSARPEQAVPAQFQQFTQQIPPNQIEAALRAAAAEGYAIPNGIGPAALRALRYTHGELALMKRDAVTTRMTLRWGAPLPRTMGCIRRVLSPGLADFATASPPAWLWPAYFAIKPARVLRKILHGRAGQVAPGRYDPGINLGTPLPLVAQLLDIAGVSDVDTLFDFGCGDGRVVTAAAQSRNCEAVGVERDAELAGIARATAQAAGVSGRVRIITGDAADTDISEATVAFLFQPMTILKPLLDRLRGNLRPGARILVHEQSPLAPGLHPDLSVPVFAANALTVAHVWYC
ncbi:SAM-dependent methyltransferase [Roseovarius sp. ZX-A-9]|uniref:SAM-dependent methyltransferase n=1 Tax=Roseovarius sp. ZX-A-9 TaxID=3014783 RepID=UPI00232CF7EE|nr:class I SAM-dependent methyltransferase [Roseovarius sp. ZX-A-9]